ncbi:MAG: hypothetical protein M3Q80_00470 [bacterium]|nr:hypothetical protein [bacterium]
MNLKELELELCTLQNNNPSLNRIVLCSKKHGEAIVLLKKTEHIWLQLIPHIDGLLIHYHHSFVKDVAPCASTNLSLNGFGNGKLINGITEINWIEYPREEVPIIHIQGKNYFNGDMQLIVPEHSEESWVHPWGVMFNTPSEIVLVIDRSKFDDSYRRARRN